ncbi:lasso peptide biosynthesis B2 protein [Nostoc sp. CHAB 5844]|nr:lasso peptide biosynthesis B2 protein [Nostoc sp. CHAB 5844]
MKQWRKLLLLTSAERKLLFNTFILLGLVRLGLWLLPFPTLKQMLASINQMQLLRVQKFSPSVSQIVEAVNRSSRYTPGGAKCLARALTTQTLMSWHGYSSELRIGVAKSAAGKFEAHAWVEVQGQIVLGYLKDLEKYTPMPSFE